MAPRRPLVSDYHLVIRSRSRPTRELSVDEVVDRLKESIDVSATRYSPLRALLKSGDQSIEMHAFQYRAADQIFRTLDSSQSGATVVASSTGSGKTLAFYLPALTYLGELIGTVAEDWTKALASIPVTSCSKTSSGLASRVRAKSLMASRPLVDDERFGSALVRADAVHAAVHT